MEYKKGVGLLFNTYLSRFFAKALFGSNLVFKYLIFRNWFIKKLVYGVRNHLDFHKLVLARRLAS